VGACPTRRGRVCWADEVCANTAANAQIRAKILTFFMVKTPVEKTGFAGGEIARRIVGTSLQLDANKPEKMARATQVINSRAITVFRELDAR
jgi:5-methylthioribose kinase